jgi:hypothetical protein
LNVAFVEATVPLQNLAILDFSDSFFAVDFSSKSTTIKMNVGMYNARQATANKQVLIFFKLTCTVASGDAALSRRIFLEILNNL